MPNTRLIICGPGKRLRKRYERWVKKHKLEDVIFTGMISNEEQPRYYRTADIFCAPATSRESFGLILLEAMATGIPIVATNIDGFKNVVNDGEEGVLVPPRNNIALAAAIMDLINNKEKRIQMGQKGINTAYKYRWEEIARRLMEYYNKTINELKTEQIQR